MAQRASPGFGLALVAMLATACDASLVPKTSPTARLASGPPGATGQGTLRPGSGAPPSAADLGACAVATVEDVATVYGVGIETAQASATDTHLFCDYSARDGVAVSVALTRTGARALFEAASDAPGETVAGIGDAAYWRSDGPGLLYILSGDALLVVQDVLGAGLDEARRLAEVALPRL